MKIAKEFRWEMGHRLKFHQGKCINLHGHSYKLMVEFTGDIDDNGMVMDYYDVKEIVAPLVDDLDHGFLVYENDIELLKILKKLNSKHTVVKFESTAENICKYFLEKISESKLPGNIKKYLLRFLKLKTPMRKRN